MPLHSGSTQRKIALVILVEGRPAALAFRLCQGSALCFLPHSPSSPRAQDAGKCRVVSFPMKLNEQDWVTGRPFLTRERPLGAHGARPQVKPKKVHFPFEGIYDDSSRNPPEDGVPTKYRKEVWEDAVMEASTARLLSLGASQEVTLPRPFLWRRPRRRRQGKPPCKSHENGGLD